MYPDSQPSYFLNQFIAISDLDYNILNNLETVIVNADRVLLSAKL